MTKNLSCISFIVSKISVVFSHSTVCSILEWIVGAGDYLKMSPLSRPPVGVASLDNLQAHEMQLHSLRWSWVTVTWTGHHLERTDGKAQPTLRSLGHPGHSSDSPRSTFQRHAWLGKTLFLCMTCLQRLFPWSNVVGSAASPPIPQCGGHSLSQFSKAGI